MRSTIFQHNPEREVIEFERGFARFLGVTGNVLGTSSGTAALHLALIGAGIGPEDSVLIPVTTFVATANAVLYEGAKVVLVDVDPVTWNLPPHALQQHDAKFAIAVHLYGVPCDLAWRAPNEKIVIEDCAEALGATFDGRHVGTFGAAGAFSFNLNKTVTTGGGGMLWGNGGFPLGYVRNIARQAKADDETHSRLGYNYRMNTDGARSGLVMLRNLGARIAKQREINDYYRNNLWDIVQFQNYRYGMEPSWWYTACLLPDYVDPAKVRDVINNQVNGWERPARRVFRPLCDSVHLKCEGEFPVARMLWERGLCLPSSHLLQRPDLEKVCDIVREFCGG